MKKLQLRFKQLAAITWKNIKIYYSEPPVLIFGLFFPFFLFLAFALGRQMAVASLMPAFLGITLFFTGSSVGPYITPWETRTRTLERMVASPAPFYLIILGDIMAGFIFGITLTVFLVLAVSAFVSLDIFSLPLLFISLAGGSFCFAALGSLFSALPTEKPSNVMMLSNLVRLPLIFISGVFVPLGDLPQPLRFASYLSPLTYTVELLNYSLVGESYLSLIFSFMMSLLFTGTIIAAALSWHQKSLLKRL
ncbi:MAG: ABC transporter permease [bacterium]